MRCVIACIASLAIGSPVAGQTRIAPATIKKRIVTASGDAEMILPGGVSDSRAKLAGLCQKLGWSPRLAGDVALLNCDVPSTERTIVATSNVHDLFDLVASKPASVPVRKQVTFVLSADRGGTVVRARGMRMYPPINGGTPVRQYMNDENTFNGLINVMALIGGRFAPGTAFRNIGYLGFRSDEVVDRETTSGLKRTGILVGAIDLPSPVSDAGLRVGDLILMINDRGFGDYEGAAKILSKLRPGDPVILNIERDKAALTVSLVAGRPMMIR